MDLAEKTHATASPEAPSPWPVLPPLSQALGQIDRVFGCDGVLRDEGRDVVAAYYTVSETGYRRVHSSKGCMHQALSSGPEFHPRDFRVQAQQIVALARASGARRVLELGSGQGFNCQIIADALPEVEVLGIDLMEHHVANARAAAGTRANLHYRQASFDSLPADVAGFDLIFSIEAACYARDLDAFAADLAGRLAPGGQLVLFDAYRAVALERMTAQMATAVRLYEITTAVAPGFRRTQDWAEALGRHGFAGIEVEDLTPMTVPSVRRLHGFAARYFNDWKIRAGARLFSELLRRNAIGALLGTYIVEGEEPGRALAPAEARGITYARILARKA